MVQNLIGGIVLGFGFLILAGAYWVVKRGRISQALVRRMDHLSETSVSALDPGQTGITGTVQETDDTELVTGPMSGEEGVIALSEIALPQANRVEVLDRTVDWTPFEIDDGTSRIRIEPPDRIADHTSNRWPTQLKDRSFLGLAYDFTKKTPRAGVRSGIPNPEESRDLHAVFDNQLGPDSLPPGQNRIYQERVIEPGEELFIFGEATRSDSDPADPAWTLTAGDDGPFLISDKFATREGRESVRREWTWSKRLSYGFAAFVSLFGLAVSAAGVTLIPDPLVGVIYAVLFFLGALLLVNKGRRVIMQSFLFRQRGPETHRWQGSLFGGVLGVVLTAVGGYFLASRYQDTGSLITASAWYAYLLVGIGLFILWGGLTAFLYYQYGIDLPFRGKMFEQE